VGRVFPPEAAPPAPVKLKKANKNAVFGWLQNGHIPMFLNRLQNGCRYRDKVARFLDTVIGLC
jgi:hypothetical protein